MNKEIRALFPVTENYIYFNHAAVSPLSTRVREAMRWLVDDVTQNGSVHYFDWCDRFEAVRQAAARLVNAKPHEIAFMQNTSAALSAIANGIDWRAGDNVVVSKVEFPANIYPWMRLVEERGIVMKMVEERDGRIDAEEVISLIDERTRAVSLSWVQFSSGFRADLATIGKFCRQRQVIFMIDAIQGLGGLHLDVVRDSVDALAADSHKYLLGPEGIALLYVSENILARIKPTVVGWMSVNDADNHLHYDLNYREGALRFECGTLNSAGVYGLGAALELFLEVGAGKIEAHILSLSDYLAQQLTAKGYAVFGSRKVGETSAIVTCTHPQHPAKPLYELLLAQNIITAPRVGRLRIAPHFYNTHEEIDALIAALPE
ncbi:MAG: aminotransferase class V-fold PLP-dependent enzyme [Acidobacteria bacterium]|nr:aminotransferase class V-fold PLP-dependent enzyme [Acidobacteriota bacterium]